MVYCAVLKWIPKVHAAHSERIKLYREWIINVITITSNIYLRYLLFIPTVNATFSYGLQVVFLSGYIRKGLNRMRGTGTFCCKSCGKVYIQKQTLTRHLNYECGKQPKYQCSRCPYLTKHKSSLQLHLSRCTKLGDHCLL